MWPTELGGCGWLAASNEYYRKRADGEQRSCRATMDDMDSNERRDGEAQRGGVKGGVMEGCSSAAMRTRSCPPAVSEPEVRLRGRRGLRPKEA